MIEKIRGEPGTGSMRMCEGGAISVCSIFKSVLLIGKVTFEQRET